MAAARRVAGLNVSVVCGSSNSRCVVPNPWIVWKRCAGSSVTVTSVAGSAAGRAGQDASELRLVEGPPSPQADSASVMLAASVRTTLPELMHCGAAMTTPWGGREASERRTLSREVDRIEPHAITLGRRELLPEREGVRCRSIGAQPLEPCDSFGDRGAVPGGHPPEHDERVGHPREPFPAPTHDLGMCALIHIRVQRGRALPHGHGDDDHVVVVRTDRRRIAVLRLQPPDESGSAIGDRVDLVESRDELGHDDRVDRAEDAADVELGEMEDGHVRMSEPSATTAGEAY